MNFAAHLDRWAGLSDTMDGPAKRAKRKRKKAARKARKGKPKAAARLEKKAGKLQARADRKLAKKTTRRTKRKGLPDRTQSSLATIEQQAATADAQAVELEDKSAEDLELEESGEDEPGFVERYRWPLAAGIVASAVAVRVYMRQPKRRR